VSMESSSNSSFKDSSTSSFKSNSGNSKSISKSIQIGASPTAVYSQCTRFEKFPNFIEGIKEVRQLSHSRLYCRTQLLGLEREWEADIEEQIPDRRISWRCTVGASHSGSLELEPLEETKTRLCLTLSFDPAPSPERIPLIEELLQRQLEMLKELLEAPRPIPRHGKIEEGQVGRVKDYPE